GGLLRAAPSRGPDLGHGPLRGPRPPLVRAPAIPPGPVADPRARRRAAAKNPPADAPVHLPASARLRKHAPAGRTRPQRARLLCPRKFRLDALSGTTPRGLIGDGQPSPAPPHNDTAPARPPARRRGSSQNDVFGAPMMVTRQTGTGRALGRY